MDIDHPLLQISEVGEYEDFEEYSKVLIESALDAQKQDGTHHYRLNDIYSLASFLILLNSSITDALQIVELKRNFQEIAEDYEFESTNNKKEESKTTHGSKSIIPLIRIVEAILRMCDLAPNTASHIKRRRDYIEEKYDSSSEISESDLKLLDDDVDYWYDSVADALAEKRRIAVVEEGTLSINDLLNNPGEFFRMDI